MFLLHTLCIIIYCIRRFCSILCSVHFTFTLDNVIHSYDPKRWLCIGRNMLQ